MLRVLGAYVLAVLITYVLAAMAATQWVLGSLQDMGVAVDAATRWRVTSHDLAGMLPLYLPIIAAAFAVALPVAAAALRVLPSWRPVGYPLAGGVAVFAVHVILNQTFEITPIAAARSALGLTVQSLCGVFGGWIFLQCLPDRA